MGAAAGCWAPGEELGPGERLGPQAQCRARTLSARPLHWCGVQLNPVFCAGGARSSGLCRTEGGLETSPTGRWEELGLFSRWMLEEV